eukprot:285434-Chlamydomonas_euryale.AAC.1
MSAGCYSPAPARPLFHPQAGRRAAGRARAAQAGARRVSAARQGAAAAAGSAGHGGRRLRRRAGARLGRSVAHP